MATEKVYHRKVLIEILARVTRERGTLSSRCGTETFIAIWIPLRVEYFEL